MTSIQKVIKYVATAFAIFLIITIISGILTGGYAILSALKLISSNNDYLIEDSKTILENIEEVSSLNIKLSYTNLYIRTGSTFRVETNNSKIIFEEDNSKIKISEEKQNWLKSKNAVSNLTIYIPENMSQIEEANIETETGEVYIENITVTDKSKIDGGIGKTELNSCKINNLKANIGIGEFKFKGSLTGKNEIDSGIGAIDINLNNDNDTYKIDVSKGIGNVIIDGQNVTDGVHGSGENYLKLNGGIGEIKINFST